MKPTDLMHIVNIIPIGDDKYLYNRYSPFKEILTQHLPMIIQETRIRQVARERMRIEISGDSDSGSGDDYFEGGTTGSPDEEDIGRKIRIWWGGRGEHEWREATLMMKLTNENIQGYPELVAEMEGIDLEYYWLVSYQYFVDAGEDDEVAEVLGGDSSERWEFLD